MLSAGQRKHWISSDFDPTSKEGCHPSRALKVLAGIFLFFLLTAKSFAQTTTAPESSSSFTNEFYSGGAYTRAKVGPNLSDTNFGGWNISSARYFTAFLGAAVDAQGMYGHAPVAPSTFTSSGPLVSKYLYLAGPEFRWHQGRRISGGIRLLAGVSDTNVSTSSGAYSSGALCLYPNATKLALKPGGTFDINLSSRWAIRYSAGVLLERENADIQRDLNLSCGLVFRFGQMR
jgi:hypothetical protein